MLIYSGSTDDFIRDVQYNRIADIMEERYYAYTGKKVSTGEYHSWQNSLGRVRDVVEIAKLKDNMVELEYQVPYNDSRIDCLIFGKDSLGLANVVLIELKQWEQVTATENEGNFVETFVGGNTRLVSHPSQQAEGYHNYLMNFVEEFENLPPIQLTSMAYCHNYSRKPDDAGLFAPQYQEVISRYPVYCKEDVQMLANRLRDLLQNGSGLEIFNRFMQSRIRPGKKLLEHAHKLITSEQVFSLINEQLVAKNMIMAKIRQSDKSYTKSVVIVKGGLGTGKSVIALNLLAEAAGRGKNVSYACKSKSFLGGLKKMVGQQAGLLFNNLYQFVPNRAKENQYDLILVDEAHRIQESSNFQYTKADDRTDMPQIEQLIRSARTSVFFIDDLQSVRTQEVGNTYMIRQTAVQLGARVESVQLESQFRCMGSNDYLLWVESILGLDESRRTLTDDGQFDFRIFNSPTELYNAIHQKESEKPNSARLVAGYCWPWSDPNPDGTLVNDVVIGDFAMPWEAREGKRVTRGIPFWYQWAYHPGGINQVGCIYTVQGFEFEYIGVIIGPDLTFDASTDSLTGDYSRTHDPTLKRDKKGFDQFVKNIYRVLLTRGLRGCYVYFVDKEVEEFVRKRIIRDETN
ncbi:MAG: DUF2075 domain-containing protein [Bacteroidota bacterium]